MVDIANSLCLVNKSVLSLNEISSHGSTLTVQFRLMHNLISYYKMDIPGEVSRPQLLRILPASQARRIPKLGFQAIER